MVQKLQSLKAALPQIAEILHLNPYSLYERQRALVRGGLIKSTPGRGRGSGTIFSPENVALLIVSMLATDSIADCIEKTHALAAVRLQTYSEGREQALGGAKTFKAALINALADDAIVEQITYVRVHRRKRFVAEIFLMDDEEWQEPPAGYIFSRAELIVAAEKDAMHFFAPKEWSRDYSGGGLVVSVEVRGGAAWGKGGGEPALGKIRALLRDSEAAERKEAARKSKPKGHEK
jgi:DNA-binding IscR family transcriptional regulator